MGSANSLGIRLFVNPLPAANFSSWFTSHQKYGTDGFGGVGHEDGSTVATHLCEVWKGSTVVQVKVAIRTHGRL